MIAGVATDTVGEDGAAHDIAGAGAVASAGGAVISHCMDVSPVVIGDIVTGGAGAGLAVLTSLNATQNPPIAVRAAAPIPADSNLI